MPYSQKFHIVIQLLMVKNEQFNNITEYRIDNNNISL